MAESNILSESWLSAATLADAFARRAVLTAAVEQPTPVLRRVMIRRQGSTLIIAVYAIRAMSPTFIKSVEAVAELLNLAPGWNSYAAKPIDPQNAVRAIQLLGELLEPQTPPPAIVPRVQGGIQLEWHTDEIDIEVYIDMPNRVSFFAEHTHSGQSVESGLVGQEEVLKAWVQRLSER